MKVDETFIGRVERAKMLAKEQGLTLLDIQLTDETFNSLLDYVADKFLPPDTKFLWEIFEFQLLGVHVYRRQIVSFEKDMFIFGAEI